MTREAKVGLLLGLVFIVAIAVVLRDVHHAGTNYADETLSLSEVDNGASENTISEGVNLSVAVQQLSSSESQNPPVRISPPKQDAVINRMDMMKPENTDPVSPVSFREQEPEIRYERTLPSTEIVPPAEHPGPVVSDTAIAPPSGELERALDSIVTQGAPGPIVTTVPGTVVMAGNLVQPEKKKTQIYVVSKGDDLSKIAKKVYGEKEGNRWVNIKKIYSANSMVLNSMDDVRIGQELAIPELATEQGVAVAIQDIQKVALGEKETSKSRVYEVKDGDSLWQIAERELGKGARYQEIAQLNKEMIRKAGGPEKMYVGMKLRLPE